MLKNMEVNNVMINVFVSFFWDSPKTGSLESSDDSKLLKLMNGWTMEVKKHKSHTRYLNMSACFERLS